MLQVKLPYYPKTEAFQTETRFGVREISEPEIYETPLTGRYIVRVDLLECLKDVFDDECYINREFLYCIMSGSEEKYVGKDVFSSFYRKYKKVRTYVNNKYHFGDESIPIYERCIIPLRSRVDSYHTEIYELFKSAGAKYLIDTHDFIYFSFVTKDAIPEMNGVKIIC